MRSTASILSPESSKGYLRKVAFKSAHKHVRRACSRIPDRLLNLDFADENNASIIQHQRGRFQSILCFSRILSVLSLPVLLLLLTLFVV